ncbi:MAG TPA: PfkB family carbohydrate kinase [Gemmatimonadaceae bacterium]|nr:PfkB family carbohydrate kinase [Gemmatimonadaceae bacterium]
MIETISRDRLIELLEAGADKRIAIVGDAMLDVYLRGDVDRISPEAPVPVVRVRDRELALGGAANVAQNIDAIGARADLVCAVGDDAEGQVVKQMLRGIRSDPRSVVTVARRTTTKTRVLARSQQVVRFDEEEDVDIAGDEMVGLVRAALDAVAQADALVLEDYNKGVLTPALIAPVMQDATAKEIPIVVDPKYRNFFSYKGATIFKPNRRELESALGAAVDIEHPEALPESIKRLGVENLLLTLGDAGMALIDATGEVGRVPTTAREVYDVVGAGDTVTAYLATMMAAGATAAEAAVIANFAAGVEVAKLGAATVSIDEVIDAYDQFTGTGAAEAPTA